MSHPHRVHTWYTVTWAPVQNGVVFRYWELQERKYRFVPEDNRMIAWKKGVFTLVPCKNGTKALYLDSECEHSLRKSHVNLSEPSVNSRLHTDSVKCLLFGEL